MRTDVARAVIAQCLEDDRRWSLQALQAYTGIDQATVHNTLREDLHMRKIAEKWVPHALTELQKSCRYETCIHLERYQNEGENLLNNIITMLAALAQMVACLPLVQQVRGSITGGVVNFHLKIFNLGARRGGDTLYNR